LFDTLNLLASAIYLFERSEGLNFTRKHFTHSVFKVGVLVLKVFYVVEEFNTNCMRAF
jgi:hypothetical protein